jgi:hypothetical protein
MALDNKLIDQLLADYKKPEDIIGENGLLKQLTKAILERALAAEMTEHLGYEKHDPVGHHRGNTRNGKSPKTLKGEFGELELETPRDRKATFDPKIVAKGQKRWTGFDDKIISMYSRHQLGTSSQVPPCPSGVAAFADDPVGTNGRRTHRASGNPNHGNLSSSGNGLSLLPGHHPLGQPYPFARMEAAAKRALKTGAANFKSLQSILRHSLDQTPLSAPAPAHSGPTHDNVRGAAYFEQGGETC